MSGSIINRKSFASWLTLDPTSPAPIRMTIVLGFLLFLSTGTWVRFLCRLRAILNNNLHLAGIAPSKLNLGVLFSLYHALVLI